MDALMRELGGRSILTKEGDYFFLDCCRTKYRC